MFGYKAFNKDMTCRDFQFKEGETFIHKGYFAMCDRGFHFCLKPEDCFNYYDHNNCVIHRVEVPDYVKEFNDKSRDKGITNKITILEEFDLNKIISTEWEFVAINGNKDERIELAKKGLFLNILVSDPVYEVRVEVAKHGYGLDVLVMDPSWSVRVEVAKHGYGLDILVDDDDVDVLREVAKKGYGLEKLIGSGYNIVRAEVVKQHYCLDKLISDRSWFVKSEVAKQGYGLDILINDDDPTVKATARHYQEIKKYML